MTQVITRQGFIPMTTPDVEHLESDEANFFTLTISDTDGAPTDHDVTLTFAFDRNLSQGRIETLKYQLEGFSRHLQDVTIRTYSNI